MWMMLQQNTPDDYVLATGRTHSARDFVNAAGEALGFDLEWSGDGANARGIDKRTGKAIVIVAPEFYRPAEVDLLIGDSSKAKQKLNWEAKTRLEELVQMMAKADYDRVQSGVLRL
jgi:GDPmannose 4,6-dehydratase